MSYHKTRILKNLKWQTEVEAGRRHSDLAKNCGCDMGEVDRTCSLHDRNEAHSLSYILWRKAAIKTGYAHALDLEGIASPSFTPDYWKHAEADNWAQCRSQHLPVLAR